MPGSISEEIQKLAPSAILEFFVLDMTLINLGQLYFHAGTNALTQEIVWQGITYFPYPIEATGFEMTAGGSAPRPNLKVANITGAVGELARENDDLVGCKLIRKRTLAKFLDGQPDEDPSAAFPDDVFFVERKVAETRVIIEWELSTAFDMDGLTLPKRKIIANLCPWAYRGQECGYTGPPVADELDNLTTDPVLDQCAKRFESCKLRFPTKDNPIPFGGFPSVGRFQS